MENKSTMSPLGFLLIQGLWTLYSLYLYKSLLFRCLDGFTLRQSQGLLIFSLAICLVAGTASQIRCRRTGFQIFCNIVTGLGLYTVFTYHMLRPLIIGTILVFCFALALLYTFLLLTQRYPAKDFRVRRRLFRRRIRKAVAVFFSCFAIGFGAILVSVGCPLLVGNRLLASSATPDTFFSTKDNQADALLQLQPDCWENLSVFQKLDVLQIVANQEQQVLGLPHELNVGTSVMDENTYGYYVSTTHEIVLNLDHLTNDSPDEVLDTLCHEAYHSYQHCLADLYDTLDDDDKKLPLFQSAANYASEFKNYADGEDDFYLYYGQACETDARAYASYRAEAYYEQIYQHNLG